MMISDELVALLCAILSAALAIGPWMFKVHAKLAVIASKSSDLCEKLERAADESRRLWEVCNRHRTRLESHEVQLAHIDELIKRERGTRSG